MKNVVSVTEVKPYTPSEVAMIYGVSLKTFNRWLRPHHTALGTREGRYYNARQVRIIFDRMGLPGEIIEA